MVHMVVSRSLILIMMSPTICIVWRCGVPRVKVLRLVRSIWVVIPQSPFVRLRMSILLLLWVASPSVLVIMDTAVLCTGCVRKT